MDRNHSKCVSLSLTKAISVSMCIIMDQQAEKVVSTQPRTLIDTKKRKYTVAVAAAAMTD